MLEEKDVLEIAKTAAIAAVSCKSELIQEEFDTRYRDVKLLMRNYRKLRKYYDNVTNEVLEVSVISSTRHKTGLMMNHVEKMLAIYEALCKRAENQEECRRWEVLYLRYISDERLSLDDIADRLGITRRTLHRDTDKAMEDMAVLLFGIEAIGTWKHGGTVSKHSGRQ